MENNDPKHKTKTIKLSFITDLTDSSTIGEVISDNSTPFVDSINNRIAESIKQALYKLGHEWIFSFKKYIEDNNYIEAYNIFHQNLDKFQFCSDKSIIDDLIKMDLSILDHKSQLEYLIQTVALGHKLNQIQLVSNYIDILLSNFKDDLDNILVINLELALANNAANNNQFSLAQNIYNDLLSKDIDNATKAWIYRGLSLISLSIQEYESHSLKSFNLFLMSGNLKEAISDLIGLSTRFYSLNSKKCIFYIKESIKILKPDTALDKERLGSLYFHLSSTLYRQKEFEEASKWIEQSVLCREKLIGNQEEMYATYILAYEIFKTIDNKEKKEYYCDKLSRLVPLITNAQFQLRIKISNLIKEKKGLPSELISQIEGSDDIHLKVGLYILLGTQKEIPLKDRFHYLDLAVNISKQNSQYNEDLALSYFVIANNYEEQNQLEPAMSYMKKGLEIDPYQRIYISKICNFHKKNNEWQNLYDFLETKKEIYRSSQHLMFMKALSLFKLDRIQESFQILTNIKTTDDLEHHVNDLILQCTKSGAIPHIQFPPIKQKDIDIFHFRNLLEDCAESISRDSRMHFWKYDSEKKRHFWDSSPEETGKQLILQYLNGRLKDSEIEILDEIKVSAGRIDLYIKSVTQTFIVEIKICGAGYSSTYAIEGEDQLIHYMKGKNTFVGYLFVFDGRIRDQGKYFVEENSTNNYTIYNIICDLNPRVK